MRLALTPRRVSRLLVIIGLLFARTVVAQVRGTVVDVANAPVAGVSVFITDSLNHVFGRALTNSEGTFRFATVAPGRYRLRTMRIGFRATTGSFFDVVAGVEAVQRLTLSGVQVRLDTLRVVAGAVCSATRDSSAATNLVWEQARAALTATQLTASDRQLFATTVGYERFYDPQMRAMSGQRVRVHSDSARTPWDELPADSLHRIGYVITDKATSQVTFHAPGIETLLSPVFLEDHCFRLAADSVDATRIGLAFEPNAERRDIADVKGTLWLDRRTSELRSLQYEYVNVARLLSTARGSMGFAHAAKGSWIISAWNIRMPEISNGTMIATGRRAYGGDPRVVGVNETGGEVSLVKADGDTAWSHPLVRFVVAVTDSASGKPLPGATVTLEEARAEVLTDSAGRATIDGVAIGNYTMYVSTPELEELGVRSSVRLSVIDSETVMGFRLPSIERRRENRFALAGSVVGKDGTTPIVAAEVSIPELSMATRTDGSGNFGIDHIPQGEYEVQFRRIGYGAVSTRVRFTRNRLMNRKVIMEPIVELDSVVTTERATDRTMGQFEEHRRLGVGKFVTRDSLALMEDRTMTDVLSLMNGIDLQSLHRGSRGYAATRHLGRTCLAQVFLDNVLVYRGGSGQPPFDVNSIQPTQVEAIEFYSGLGTTPTEYLNRDSLCGALVIWTRRAPP